MVKKTYSVTLEDQLVEEALKISKFYGGKLSPIINSLLEEWVKDQKQKLKEGDN